MAVMFVTVRVDDREDICHPNYEKLVRVSD